MWKISREIIFLTWEIYDFIILDAAAAAAAKSLQSCPTLCDPIDGSPSGSTVPGIFQARTPEQVAISFSNAWKWKVKVRLLNCIQLLATPWTVANYPLEGSKLSSKTNSLTQKSLLTFLGNLYSSESHMRAL